MPTSYSSRVRRAMWLAFASAPIIGIAGAILLRRIQPGEHAWLVFALLTFGCGLALLACVPWWKRLDDMQKHGHLVSWYWGGTAGGIVALMGLVAAKGIRSEMASGGMAVLLAGAVVFLIVLVVWSIRQTSSSA